MHPEVIDARFRAYKSFYKDIQIGMTHDDVMLVLRKHYPDTGPRLRPELTASTTNFWFVMNPEKFQEPNCEGILLHLNEGRVISKKYMPD